MTLYVSGWQPFSIICTSQETQIQFWGMRSGPRYDIFWVMILQHSQNNTLHSTYIKSQAAASAAELYSHRLFDVRMF